MSADGDRALGEHFHGLHQPGATFNLDHIRARTHDGGRIFKGLFRRRVSHKRQIGEQQAIRRAATHRLRVVSDILNRHRQGGVMPLYCHPQGIPDQHHIDPFVGKQSGETVVISSNGGEAFFLLFALLQQREGGRFHNIS